MPRHDWNVKRNDMYTYICIQSLVEEFFCDYYFIDKELARAIIAMIDNGTPPGLDTKYVYEVC